MNPKLCPQFSRVAIVSSILSGRGVASTEVVFSFLKYRALAQRPRHWGLFYFVDTIYLFPTGQGNDSKHILWLATPPRMGHWGCTRYYTWPLPEWDI